MKYYAVKNGRSTGIYNNWSDCESQVKGHSGSQFKSFKTRAEANSYMNGGSGSNSNSHLYSGSHRSKSNMHNSLSTSKYIPYFGSSSSGSSHCKPCSSSKPLSSSSLSCSSSLYSKSSSHPKISEVYTDGASKNNQAAKSGQSKAGYGVYYGPNDSRNYCGRVSGEQTNNRGELQAIQHALKNAVGDVKSGKASHHRIHTDSQYSIDSIIKWSKNWEKNGWKTSTGSDVRNKDIIQDCREHIETIRSHQGQVEFAKVKGHSGNHGNEMADRLAVEGCTKEL